MKLKKTYVQKPRKWKKNLYENHGFLDNYTDTSFLEELRKNLNVKDSPLPTIILGAGRVTHELCIIVLFTVIFVYLYNGWVEPEAVFMYSGCLTSLGYILYRFFLTGAMPYTTLLKDLRTVLVFLGFGYVLSPVLKTLTDTISTDTIYAMSTFMMFIHLVFFDYGISASIVSSALSLNAALFASVCLASRLATPFHAFVLLTNTVECFALLPILVAEIEDSAVILSTVILLSLVALCTVSVTMTVLFSCVVIFVTIICPLLFKKWTRYKENIYGPWDEAVVEDQEM
ncbi:Phosphatidylinositol N-acetylglucosaminyltransferase subunit C [Gryllus bimaculatus]|nr:Phosphatidylinositol N-acetylglucosaminyltransferase subunit C [Gryllus bimaculatus]